MRLSVLAFALSFCAIAVPSTGAQDLDGGDFAWRCSPILVEPLQREGDFHYSVKDPSIVFHNGMWHLFVTIRGKERSHQVEHIMFKDWNNVADAKRTLLPMHGEGYFCAPQVFYFTPHEKWYMICQASDESWEPKYGASFSTTDDITDPMSWSPLKPMGQKLVGGKKAGLDFWVICDNDKAHLFFTTLDGRMWREETTLDQFPHGWSEPELAVRDDIFEASHIYRLKGRDKYLALIEAQNGHGWRYYKAYLADRLDGEWTPVAATKDHAFASQANVTHPDPRWTESVSHIELIREGVDEHLEVDPNNLRVVFQGALNKDKAGKPYGQIPWRLGILEPAASRD